MNTTEENSRTRRNHCRQDCTHAPTRGSWSTVTGSLRVADGPNAQEGVVIAGLLRICAGVAVDPYPVVQCSEL